MLPHHKVVLQALESGTLPEGEMCVGFTTLAYEIREITGARNLMSTRVIRRIVRILARKGFAEYHKGLITCDGEFAGAGYCITKKGIEWLEAEKMI